MEVKEHNKPEIASILIVYFIVFTGILSLLVLLLLLSVGGFTGLGSNIAKKIMSIILLPLAFDIILIAPGVATSLLFLLIILPLGLITVVILRIIYSELLIKVLPYIYTKLQSIKNKFELEIDNSKKYGQATLTAVSLGQQ